MKILIIDDSKAVHSFVTTCFEGTSVTLQHAYNGREGVENFAANPDKFDLVLLDWEMPVMTGPQAFQEMKNKGIKIPVVMMTSKNSVSDISSMLEAGVAEYILKPFVQDILFEKIESVTGVALNKAA